jgi:DNA-binding MarR family transcriptional regulator
MDSNQRKIHLTPRGRQVLNLVMNSVALGTHDEEADIGTLAKTIGTTAGRLQSVVGKLAEQGLITVKRDFIYPTVAALRWQDPSLSERDARTLLRKLK